MNRSRSLFTNSYDAPSPEYKYVLNAADERSQEVKAHCEDLWCDFSECADKQFLAEFPLHFHQRWFEMYLTVSLIRMGLPVECPKPGPDILLRLNGVRIWVEAVCATEGLPGKPDSVPPTEYVKAQEVPIKQYVTRICNSLDEKQRKLREYEKKGIVNCGDHQVIAINSGEISGLFGKLDVCMMRSLYGIGDMFVNFNKTSGKFGEIGHQSILTIAKSSGAEIGVQPFVEREYETCVFRIGILGKRIQSAIEPGRGLCPLSEFVLRQFLAGEFAARGRGMVVHGNRRQLVRIEGSALMLRRMSTVSARSTASASQQSLGLQSDMKLVKEKLEI